MTSFSFLLYVYSCSYEQSVNDARNEQHPSTNLKRRGDPSIDETNAKRLCYSNITADYVNHGNLTDINPNQLTSNNNQAFRSGMRSITDGGKSLWSLQDKSKNHGLEKSYFDLQSQLNSEFDTQYIFNIGAAICNAPDSNPINNSLASDCINASYLNKNTIAEENQQALLIGNLVPYDEYMFDYDTLEHHTEPIHTCDIFESTEDSTFTAMHDMPVVNSERQNVALVEDLDIIEAFQSSQFDEETNVELQSSLVKGLHIPRETSTEHNNESQDLNAMSELDTIIANALQQIEPYFLQNGVQTYRFLSLGVNSGTKPSFKRCIDEMALHFSTKPTPGGTKQNIASSSDWTDGYSVFTRVIDLGNSETANLNVIATKQTLFGDIEAGIKEVLWKITDMDQFIRTCVFKQSVYSFIDTLAVNEYNYKSMHDLYFLFMICYCLQYDEHLQCWVLRDDLWGTHVFMAEFYPHIVWKLEKFNLENVMQLNDDEEEEYKKNIKEELKLFCVILELYRASDAKNAGSDNYAKCLALINYHVEKLREVIQQHLILFYDTNFATLLFYLANTLKNHDVSANDIDKFLSNDITDKFILNLISDIKKSKNLNVKKTTIGRETMGTTNLEFYKGIENIKMSKNILLVFAFTANTNFIGSSICYLSNFRNIDELKEVIKKKLSNNMYIAKRNNKSCKTSVAKKKNLSSSAILQREIIRRNEYRILFGDTLLYLATIIKLIRRKNSEPDYAKFSDYNSKISNFIKSVDSLMRQRKMAYLIGLVLYHEVLLHVMEAKSND